MVNPDTRFLDKAAEDAVIRLAEKLASRGGGGDNGGMDGRIGKLEGVMQGVDTRLSLVEKDLRELGAKLDRQLYFMLAGFGSLLTAMAKGFHWF